MLPIRRIERQIVEAVRRSNRLVLSAPTGSGKTTQVPQILWTSGQAGGQVLVLQPRRLATRMLAARVAAELGRPLGDLVGYQTRHASCVGPDTPIRFMTDGMFLRRLQADPALAGVAAVVLDEFHERSIAADTALGLVMALQAAPSAGRPDLRLLVMSATLDTAAVAAHLGCPRIEATGRTHPVHVAYLPRRVDRPCWELAAEMLPAILEDPEGGDLLIFMPGAYEIRRTIEACRQRVGHGADPITFFPLHGGLGPDRQDAAVGPCPHRKVIVATNVAETSLTIEGVRHVLDSGLARVHRHDPRRGIDVLLVEPISQASADQRAGRAGRTGPGRCIRLWPASEQRSRPASAEPEIQRVDLAQTLLQLKALGIADLGRFPWLHPPPEPAVLRAHAELADLGALEPDGSLGAVGRDLARFPMHPRLGRMLLEAATRRCLGRATLWAALLSERDMLVRPLEARHGELVADAVRSDLVTLERAFHDAVRLRFEPQGCAHLGIHAGAARDVEATVRLYRAQCRRLGLAVGAAGATEDLIKCLLAAFPDRVARRRNAKDLTCAMAGQRRVVLDRTSAARDARLLLALDVRETEAGAGVRTVLGNASTLDAAWLRQVHPRRVAIRTRIAWNRQRQAVEQAREHCFGDLVYRRVWRCQVDPADAAPILVERVLKQEIRLKRWDQSVEQWIARTRCVARWCPQHGLIRYDDQDLAVILHEIVAGATRAGEVVDRPCLPAVRGALSWSDQQSVERLAPAQILLPGGARLKVVYHEKGPPRGRARIQDLFGLEQTPRVGGGTQPLLLEILAPNFRPVQVTDDLAGFWRDLYPRLRSQLKPRYPRHRWP